MMFLFSISLGPIYIMPEPSYLGKIVSISTWVRLVELPQVARELHDPVNGENRLLVTNKLVEYVK
jgi:hypothetical protein